MRRLSLAALMLAAATPALAAETADVAREMRLPVPVVESVFANVEAYVNSAQGPANRLMSGVLKEVTLKAVKARLGNLDDSGPGKASEYSSDEHNATYKASVRTTRRESSETAECVDNSVTVTSAEAPPLVKDGAFTFDTAHPRVTSTSWPLTFCRSRTGSGDFGPWGLGR